MSITRVLVAGGGTLGAQSALQFALNNKKVTVYTHSVEAIERTKKRLNRFAKVYKTQDNYSAEAVDSALDGITITEKLESTLSKSDLIFECLPEDKSIKRNFFIGIQEKLRFNAIVATNSSTFLPSYFTGCFDDPTRFVAVHLANEIWSRNIAEIMPPPAPPTK
ncbi:3-hydroxyacyl-CoA dehydrogenase NAD-binding domain-containing protein [Corynebacterium parakroppenstedtii]|uniref:3-hydroxyacyl-CoA dehydrogenase NAD-binding domain-containing protein n=1 Tax=Corynebacterium parakroppenstedtii TaxID=2828363 RepID=UPI0030EC59CA